MAVIYQDIFALAYINGWTGNVPTNEIEEISGQTSGGDSETVINDDDLPPSNANITKSRIGVGIRVQKTLYYEPQFVKACGLYLQSDLVRNYRGMSRKVFRQYNEAASFGAFRSYTVNLTAEAEATVYPPYGKEYTTYIVVAIYADMEKLKTFLTQNPILVGDKKIKYRIDPESLRERHSRKSIINA